MQLRTTQTPTQFPSSPEGLQSAAPVPAAAVPPAGWLPQIAAEPPGEAAPRSFELAAAVVWAVVLLPAAAALVAPLVVEAVPFEALALEVLVLLLQAAQPFVVLAPPLQVGRLLGQVAQLLPAAAVLVGQAGPSSAVAAAWLPAAAPPPAQSDPPTRPTLGAAGVA